MQIDCYGFEATSQFFRRKELDAHLMKRIDGVLYVCFGGEAERPIHRLDKDEHGRTKGSDPVRVPFLPRRVLLCTADLFSRCRCSRA